MPNLRQLEYLVALAETLNFRKAAERTGTTQPTLSEQLKALETRLGAQLVERSRSHVLMTPVGEQVVTVARRMLADAEEIRTLSASGGRELSGVLRLALPPTIGPYLLPVLIPELQRRFPGLKLYVREDLPSRLIETLLAGRQDLVITPMPVSEKEVTAEPMFREPLHLTLPHGHRLADQSEIRREDLAAEDVLALGQGHQLHDAVIALCHDTGARIRLDYEGTSLDTLREMVAMGLGVTFLPGLYIAAAVTSEANVVVRTLADRSVSRTIGLAWRAASAREPRYQDLAQLVQDVIKTNFPGLPVTR